MHVEKYCKTAVNQWLFSEWEGEETILRLDKVPFEILLSDLYDKVTFEAEFPL